MPDDDRGARRRGRPPVSDDGRHRQRLAISREAVRLFRDQGLGATSGEQIAMAAGVSVRTLWRLFRTKESCVEPLLSETVTGLAAALRAWPADSDLPAYLATADTLGEAIAAGDLENVLAVVRMSRTEPGLRAVWLVLQERAEPALAEALAPSMGLPPDAPEVRVYAATINAALRVATDEYAWATTDGVTPRASDRHRERLAAALRAVAGAPAAEGP